MTTKPKFTPGPWIVCRNPYQGCDGETEISYEIQAPDGTTVVESVYGDTSVIAQRHDAALIAAAPEMLDALKRAQDAMRHIGVQPYAYGDNVLAKALHAAELAIAKAEKGGEA